MVSARGLRLRLRVRWCSSSMSERLRTALTRACTAAGVPAFSPHDLRHRRVSLLHLGGMPGARIGELVGHDDLVTTARTYTHVVVDEPNSTTRNCSSERQRPRTSTSASSTARNSPAWSRPAEAPRRCGSTTVVCSTRTRVSVPSSVIVGRKLAGRALVEVGDTRTVLRPRNSSAWTTTA
jgi:hypothetical protein